MSAETLDLFADALRDIADSRQVTSDFRGLTRALLKRLSEKGLTLEQCAGPRMLNRSIETLKGHCREFGIRFPDYTPSNMRRYVMFEPSGDFLNLTGSEVQAVAAILDIPALKAGANSMCAIPAHGFDDARERLRLAGFVAKRCKPARKVKAHA